eukprot:gene40239-24716_t
MSDVTLVVRRLSTDPIKWSVDLDTTRVRWLSRRARSGSTVMRCPVGDHLSMTYHVSTASVAYNVAVYECCTGIEVADAGAKTADIEWAG